MMKAVCLNVKWPRMKLTTSGGVQIEQKLLCSMIYFFVLDSQGFEMEIRTGKNRTVIMSLYVSDGKHGYLSRYIFI